MQMIGSSHASAEDLRVCIFSISSSSSVFAPSSGLLLFVWLARLDQLLSSSPEGPFAAIDDPVDDAVTIAVCWGHTQYCLTRCHCGQRGLRRRWIVIALLSPVNCHVEGLCNVAFSRRWCLLLQRLRQYSVGDIGLFSDYTYLIVSTLSASDVDLRRLLEALA